MDAGINPTAIAQKCAHESLQVLEWVECCLARKAKRGSAIPEAEWNAIDELSIAQSGAMSRFQLFLQILARVLTAEEEIAFDALELAIDVFHRRDTFDAIDRRHVTLGCYTRAFFA